MISEVSVVWTVPDVKSMIHIIGIDLRPLWSGLYFSGSEEITDCSNVKVIQLLAAADPLQREG